MGIFSLEEAELNHPLPFPGGKLGVVTCFRGLKCGRTKSSTVQWGNLAGVLNQVIKVNPLPPRDIDLYPVIFGDKKGISPRRDSSKKTPNSTPLMRKSSENVRFKDILQHSW